MAILVVNNLKNLLKLSVCSSHISYSYSVIGALKQQYVWKFYNVFLL